MTSVSGSHLSDEAVAAFADGVLRGHARGRAARHVESCQECREAVRTQREAVLVLRRMPAPSLPAALIERLQEVPSVTSEPAAAPRPAPGFLPVAPIAAFAPPHADRHDPRHDDAEIAAQRGMWGLAALFAARARRRP